MGEAVFGHPIKGAALEERLWALNLKGGRKLSFPLKVTKCKRKDIWPQRVIVTATIYQEVAVPYTITIVCLANSWKFGAGTCVAGREVRSQQFGDWVRPVSERLGQEISPLERRYQDGSEVEVLDIVEIELAQPQPQNHQRENHVIAAGRQWARKGIVSWAQLQAAVEDPAGPLWINGYSSSNGLNDEVPEHIAKSLPRSLYLVRPQGLIVTSAIEPGFNGAPSKRKLRARFCLCGINYRIAVTDPVMSNDLPDGDTEFPDALLSVSLGEFLRGKAYKLAAAVITPQRAGAKP